MTKEIIFIGAGPIGLWTAIQIKLKNPEIDTAVALKFDQPAVGWALAQQ